MKQSSLLPALTLAGGAAAFGLHLFQIRTGFEPETELPLPGSPAHLLLAGFLVVLAVALILLTRRLPQEPEDFPSFPFACPTPNLLTLPVIGILLIALAGAADLYEGFTLNNLLAQFQSAADPYGEPIFYAAGFSPRSQQILGVLSLATAASLFPLAAACRRREAQSTFPTALTLVPPVVLVVRLILTYRMNSINPVLEAYYVELLALIFLTLAFYRLSSYFFGAAQLRRFALYACAAVALCLAALADVGSHLSSLLLYAGGAATLLGFLLLRLTNLHQEASL